MPAPKRTKFRVTHEYTISAAIGELPPHAIASLLESDITQFAPTVFLHGTDWSVGEGGDVGTSETVSVKVEPMGAESD